MNRRARSWLVAGLGIILMLSTLLLLDRLGSVLASRNDSATPTALREGVDLGRTPAPPFTLRDQAGASLTLDQLHGHPIVLTFLDSVCPHADCSLMAEYLNWTAKDLGARQAAQVSWVAVTVNPWHDTPATVSAFITSRQVSVPLHYLLGSPDQLNPVWNAYHMQAILQPDGIVLHTTGVYVLDANGNERLFLSEGFDPKALADYLRGLLTEPDAAGAASAATPGQGDGAIQQVQTVGGQRIALTAAPDQFGTYAFTVELQDDQGVPVQGATVDMDLMMSSMPMSPLHEHLAPTSPPVPGAYQVRRVLSMAGQWQATVRVTPPGAAQPVVATFQFAATY
jgi:protein SCO1/2